MGLGFRVLGFGVWGEGFPIPATGKRKAACAVGPLPSQAPSYRTGLGFRDSGFGGFGFWVAPVCMHDQAFSFMQEQYGATQDIHTAHHILQFRQ